jgi:hypothetical protein
VRYATVTDDSPLAVQIKGDTTPTPVQQKGSEVPALAVDDLVLVEMVDRRLIVLHKVESA